MIILSKKTPPHGLATLEFEVRYPVLLEELGSWWERKGQKRWVPAQSCVRRLILPPGNPSRNTGFLLKLLWVSSLPLGIWGSAATFSGGLMRSWTHTLGNTSAARAEM